MGRGKRNAVRNAVQTIDSTGYRSPGKYRRPRNFKKKWRASGRISALKIMLVSSDSSHCLNFHASMSIFLSCPLINPQFFLILPSHCPECLFILARRKIFPACCSARCKLHRIRDVARKRAYETITWTVFVELVRREVAHEATYDWIQDNYIKDAVVCNLPRQSQR